MRSISLAPLEIRRSPSSIGTPLSHTAHASAAPTLPTRRININISVGTRSTPALPISLSLFSPANGANGIGIIGLRLGLSITELEAALALALIAGRATTIFTVYGCFFWCWKTSFFPSSESRQTHPPTAVLVVLPHRHGKGSTVQKRGEQTGGGLGGFWRVVMLRLPVLVLQG